MNINYEVNRLINFAVQNNLIDELDAVYASNLLLEVLNLDEFEEVEVDDGKVTLTRVEVKEDGTLVETEKYTGHWAWKIPASVVAKMNNS